MAVASLTSAGALLSNSTRRKTISVTPGANTPSEYFSDDALQNPYTIDDSKSTYYSTVDSDGGVIVIPPAAITDITTVLNGIVAFYDGLSYTSGQTWANGQTGIPLVPTDGAAQTDYDVSLGATTSSGADDPTFNGNSATFNGSQNFAAEHANPPTIAKMHKTGAGNGSWTVFCKLTTGPTVPTVNAFFGTADTTGDVGIVLRIDSSGNVKVDQYDGTGVKTVTAATKVVAATNYNIAISRDAVGGKIGIAINSNTFQSITDGWTASITAAASYNFKIGSRGNGASKIASGVIIYGLIIADHAWTNGELVTANTFVDTYYDPLTPVPSTLPAQVTALIAQGGDGVIYIAAYAANGNGFAVTDYVTQYKLHTDSAWTTFAHAASTDLLCTITGTTNGSLYDVRRAAVTSQGQGPWSKTKTATPLAEGTGPYPLSGIYKLTIPINSNNQFQGAAQEILDPSTYRSAFFAQSDGVYYFNAPPGGAGTPNTSDTRSELRDLTNFPLIESHSHTQRWTLDTMTNNSGSFKSANVVMHQAHTASATPCKITVKGSSDGTYSIVGVCKVTDDKNAPSVDVLLVSNFILGTQIQTIIELTGTAVNMYVNGILTGTVPYVAANMSGGTWYAKGGDYPGDRTFQDFVYSARHFIVI